MKDTKIPTKGKIALAAIIANVIWGTPFKLIKIMNQEMGITPDNMGDHYLGQVLSVISLRFFIAGILTLIFAKFFIKKDIFSLTKVQWKEVIIMGLISTTSAYFFFNIGNVSVSSTINSTILAQSTIFFAAILAHFAYKNDKMSPAKIVGLIIGFAGLVISQLNTGDSLSSIFTFSFTGEGFMVIYGLLAAIATMVAKKIGSNLNSFVMTGWDLTIGAIVLHLISLAMGGRLYYTNWSIKGILLLLLLALASAIPFCLWYWAAQYGNLGEITVFKFLMPISGSILAVIMGESFTKSLATGLVLVCISIVIMNKPPKFLQSKASKSDQTFLEEEVQIPEP